MKPAKQPPRALLEDQHAAEDALEGDVKTVFPQVGQEPARPRTGIDDMKLCAVKCGDTGENEKLDLLGCRIVQRRDADVDRIHGFARRLRERNLAADLHARAREAQGRSVGDNQVACAKGRRFAQFKPPTPERNGGGLMRVDGA